MVVPERQRAGVTHLDDARDVEGDVDSARHAHDVLHETHHGIRVPHVTDVWHEPGGPLL